MTDQRTCPACHREACAGGQRCWRVFFGGLSEVLSRGRAGEDVEDELRAWREELRGRLEVVDRPVEG